MSIPSDHAPLKEQPLVEHLLELRSRILRALLVILVWFVALYAFSNDLYVWLSTPLNQLLPSGGQMIATEITSPFLVPFKLTIIAACFLAMPYLLHQFWGFMAPGLYQHEQRFAIPLLVSSTFLFYIGVTFAYYVVLPLVFGFLTAIGPKEVGIMPDISNILDFTLKIFFAFGLAFEIPVATFLFIQTGLGTTEGLKAKRPYIIVGCFAIGMLITPPDVISQTILAVPMWLLFEVGLLFSRYLAPSASR